MADQAEDKPKAGNRPAEPEPYLGFRATILRTVAKAPGTYLMGAAGGLMLVVIVYFIGKVLLKQENILRDLAEPANARGIITFIISFAAIGVAMVLILSSLFGKSDRDQFRQAREIYAGLMGILGTIVGFYFGSSDKAVPQLTLSEPKFVGREFLAHANGGVPPYRYHVTPDSLSDSTAMGERVSKDGWIQHKLKSGKPDTLALKIDIWDSKNTQVTKEFAPVKAAKPVARPADTASAAGPKVPPKAEPKSDSAATKR
jgi:hypothetical protein